jgi:hypothetical protein
MSGHAPALHDPYYVIKQQVFYILLPYIAVPASGLACRGGIDHQL